MSQPNSSQIHCINPDCRRPYPQIWGCKFCSSCGAQLQLHDRYIPLQRLGSGGFAQIYTVWDLSAQTEKVLKVLVEASPKAQELFAQEADVLSHLRNAGVPKVEPNAYFQVNINNPEPRQLACLVMEKIHGHTLEEISEKYPQGCSQEWVFNWLTQAIEILQELHRRQIIHRDIKPSNLMLRTSSHPGTERLVLIDFGGAKQVAGQPAQMASTRLFSSGYSPLEQIAGQNVSPATDFYALGRTMIQMLTGKYPPDLEDPLNGKLRWRKGVDVNPQLADLLDEMVQDDVRSRPANASTILQRLAKINQPPKPDLLAQISQSVWQSSGNAIANSTNAIGNTTFFFFKLSFQIVKACVDTVWGIFLTALGASVGTIAGALANQFGLGVRVTQWMTHVLPHLIPGIQIAAGSEIILFAAAGGGTALGLTAAGSFGQRRRFGIGSLMGIIGYGFGWLVWQITKPINSGEGLLELIVIAVAFLTLSLGLRSHQIVHAVIAASGTAFVFAALISLGLFPANLFLVPLDGFDLGRKIIFFTLMGMLLSFFLALSYYIVVPGLRLLGWR